MDEFISLMVRGIKLVKDVEESLQSLGSHGQHGMASKLDEIIRVFVSARERLINNAVVEEPSLYLYRDQLQQQQQHPAGIDPSLHEQWLRSNKSMMELFQTQVLNFAAAAERNSFSSSMAVELGAGTSSGDVQPMASSSSQRPRRRKEDADQLRTIRVPAPIMGNTEIPPEDGYTWRKYGQKEILGSKFPRGYYRCTHQKLYQCPAKKQVQRLDDDPHMYEVTYRGDHTCHMSATAPSIPPPPPPPPPEITQDMTHTMVAVDHPPTWLEFSLGGGSGGGGAGPSTVRYGKDAEYPVADMADVMFNSGSSSSNSMELIFTSMEDHKWDSGDLKKN